MEGQGGVPTTDRTMAKNLDCPDQMHADAPKVHLSVPTVIKCKPGWSF